MFPTASEAVGDDTGAGDTESSAGADTGEPVAEVWDCVGMVARPPFVEGDTPIDVTIVAFPGGRPLPDLSVLVCYDDDTACAEPHASGTSSAAGTLTIDVPTDAPIHYRVTGEAVTPSLFFRRGVPPTAGEPVELGGLTPDTLEAFVQITGAKPMADRGHLVMTARDCDAELASGVRFEIDTADADSTIVYLDGGIPSADASQTDVSGRGGVLNLPAGSRGKSDRGTLPRRGRGSRSSARPSAHAREARNGSPDGILRAWWP